MIGAFKRSENETKPEVQEVEVEEIVQNEIIQPPAKKRGRGRRRATGQEHVQTAQALNVEAADEQPAKRRSSRPKKAAAAPAAITETEAAEDEPVTTTRKVGRPKKSTAQKTNADASGVDAKTKREAERMYGPGGYSKDAYMLLYYNKHHAALVKLKEEQERADEELHDSEQPPTFLNVASHPQLAKLLIRKYHRGRGRPRECDVSGRVCGV